MILLKHILSHHAWQTVWRCLRRKHRKATWRQLRRRYANGGWWPAANGVELFDPEKVTTRWYRYRGSIIPSPWQAAACRSAQAR